MTTVEMVEQVEFLTKVREFIARTSMFPFHVFFCLLSLKSREETVLHMQAEIREAAERLKLLLDFAILSEEDIHINNRTFKWPGKMEPIFEASHQSLVERRTIAETEVEKM